MTRRNSALTFNSFVKGLVTEASPLVFPPNAALDMDNFVINRDGSLRRRLGMDFEEGWSEVATESPIQSSGELPVNAFRWTIYESSVAKNIAVIQVGSSLKFFDMDSVPLSDGLIHTYTYQQGSSLLEVDVVSFTDLDGRLVAAAGERELLVFEYDLTTNTVSSSTGTLKVRDLFGVEDIDPISGKNLRDGNDIAYRPSTLTDNHLYNLRNQTWSTPRKIENDEVLEDTVQAFREYVQVVRTGVFSEDVSDTPYYPANSDNANAGLFPDPDDGNDRLGDRFWPEVIKNSIVGSSPAPRGYFIIDAMQRGTSRAQELERLYERVELESEDGVFEAEYKVGSLPDDTTDGGASVVKSFAGRLFYAGFPSKVRDGDSYSPKMSSYVLFSRLVETSADAFRCYQDADPTSNEDPQLVDTDGGFLRISGSEQILAMEVIGENLIVFANNGVWSISGGTEDGFTSTNYRVNKITDHGCVAPQSIVEINNSVMYWAKDGIYVISGDQVGGLQAENITKSTIQSLYQSIGDLDRFSCKGHFDRYERKIRWLYNNRPSSVGSVKELVLDLDLGSFYPNSIGFTNTETRLPMPCAILETQPFRVGETVIDVTETDGTVVTTTSGDPITITETIREDTFREVIYVTVTGYEPTASISFTSYRNIDFLDWEGLDETGVDSPALLVTGYSPGEEFLRYKQVPHLHMFFLRTEDGFMQDELGDLYPAKPSSCIVQARWDWANSANSNRWGREFQAYRYRRFYIPEDINDPYDTGFELITTKNKLRGKGKVLSLLMKTEPGKDCRIQGWSMIMGITDNV